MASHSTVTFAGTFAKTGTTVSSTVITWITESAFWQSSTATHFRVIKYGQPVPISSVKNISTAESHTSLAATFAAAGIEVHSTVTSFGTFAKTGATVSSTVIIWITESAFWQSSIATHVRVIVYGQPVVITSVKVRSTKAVQLSKAVTFAAVGIALHSTVTSLGTFPKTGLTVSINVITWVPTTSLSHKSVAVHVRVIVYGQPVPTTSLNVTGRVPAQSSSAVTNAPPKTSSQLTVISEGTPVKTGRLLSSTVITCLPVIVLLQSSIAIHTRVIVYGHPVEISSEKTTATFDVQLSLAVTIAATGIEAQSTVTSVGTFAKAGASLSSTVIIWISVTTLLQESLAVQVRVIV